MRPGEIYFITFTAYTDTIIEAYYRIVCCDDYEVQYISKSIDDGSSWEVDNRKRQNYIFGRYSMVFFLKKRNPKLIDFIPYDASQFELLRPDLPLRVGRFKDVSWGDSFLDKEKDIETFLSENSIKLKITQLNASQVYLEGCNRKTNFAKPVLFKANNNSFFPIAELLLYANQVMMSIKSNKDFKSDGIGIYRSGVKGGIPCYYVWGFYDLAQFLQDYEEVGVDITYA